MKRGAWYGGVALALAGLVVAPVALAARGGGRGHGPERGARLAEALDLTAEQQEQMQAISQKYRGGALGDHARDLREARAQLRAAIHDVKASDAQVQEASRLVASHQAFVAVERHRMAIEMDRILTDEQRTKAAELRAQRMERKERRHGPPEDEIEE
jgi:Spy/CpxP family protein refolding chaperone